MMYIDALTEGLDDLPTVSDEVRSSVLRLYNAGAWKPYARNSPPSTPPTWSGSTFQILDASSTP